MEKPVNNPALSLVDMDDPNVWRKIRRNEFTAQKAMSVIAKNNAKLPPNEAIENIANTIGILAAQFVRDMAAVDPEAGRVMADLIAYHVDRARPTP